MTPSDGKLLSLIKAVAPVLCNATTAAAQALPTAYAGNYYLQVVGANPGLTQTALGAALGTARSGAMMVANWLEKRGLAERRSLPNDARAWGLHLTTRGDTHLRELNRRVRANDAAFAARLAPRDRQTLKRLLDKLSG